MRAQTAAPERSATTAARRHGDTTRWVDSHDSVTTPATHSRPSPMPARPHGDSSTQRYSLKSAVSGADRVTSQAISCSRPSRNSASAAAAVTPTTTPGRTRRQARIPATRASTAPVAPSAIRPASL
jgi:hypothetical protein